MISSDDKTSINKKDDDVKKGIHHAINLFRWIRQNDIGIIFISSKDLINIGTLLNNEYSSFIIGSIDEKKDKNLIKLTVRNVSLFIHRFKDFVLNEDLLILFQREKMQVFCFRQCIYTKHDFNTIDYVLWRSLTHEKTTEILKADLLERLSNELGTSEIHSILKSRFLQSIDENISFPIIYNHPVYRINNQHELSQVLISEVKNNNHFFWQMPYRTALLYNMIKDKKR